MHYRFLILFWVLILAPLRSLAYDFGPFVSFNESMNREQYAATLSSFSQQALACFEHWYTLYNPWVLTPSLFIKIPRIIHQIWLGSPLPEEYKQYQRAVQLLHPDWIYILWTDQEAKLFPFVNKEIFEKEPNYGSKSDIWRYEILWRFGGVYLDIDQEVLKNLEALHFLYDFYIGIQPLDTSVAQLGIGIIGSRPGHHLLKRAIELLPAHQHEPQIIMRTGPIFFTRIFATYAGAERSIDVALPATFFYPRGYTQSGDSPEQWYKPESFAVHHWAGSWLKESAFRKEGS